MELRIFILPMFSAMLAAFSAALGMHTAAGALTPWLKRKFAPRTLRQAVFAWVDQQSVGPWFTHLATRGSLTQLMAVSGLTPPWTVSRMVALKKLSLGLAVVGSALIWITGDLSWGIAFLSTLLFSGVAFYLPELYLRRRVMRRKRRALRYLGYLIDLLRLQVSSGINLSTAFYALAAHLGEPWKGELRHLVFLLDRGVPFEQALTRITARLEVEDFSRFVLALKQAQLLGVSLTATLTIQAETLRTRRKQRAEEKARLASVKIALPLVFFIFPALLIIYLGPAVLRIMQLF